MRLLNKDAEWSTLSGGKSGKGDGKKKSHGYRELLWGLLLIVLTLIAYHPAWHAGFIWDDDVYVTGNPLLTASDGLWRIWFSLDSPSQYFPLTYTAFYVERSFWGLNPVGYHWVNFLLHAANALLVWRLLAQLRVPGAWLAAAVFALHPVQVESVAWITERKNVLMGFFFLLTLRVWIKFIEGQSKRPWLFYVLALFFYALALSAKTTACTLPAVLVLILWLKKMPVGRRRLAQIAPFMAMGIGMGLVTMWWEHYHMGTQGKLFVIEPGERVLIASRALWFYAGKLLWPANLAFSYPRWTISASNPFAYGWVLAIMALGAVIWHTRRRLGRSVEVAVLFFAVTLSPVLGFIMLYTFLYSFVADHYQYLACIGLIALAVAGMKIGLDRVAAGSRFLQPVLSVALLAVLGALTWKQCGMFIDDQTLWQTTLLRNPNSWMAHVNLGNHLAEEGEIDDAISHYRQALQINPNHWDAHIGLGTALAQEGDVDGAITQYQTALQIYPDAEVAHVNLGIVLLQKGQTSEAIAQFQKGLQIDPGDIKALKYLAWLLATSPEASLRNGARAVELAQRANMLTRGENPDILHILAVALAEAGRFPEALEIAQRVLQMAEDQSNSRMAGQIQYEMSLYRADKPFHTPQ
jgi:tetratricopeptide (TPR) repeat protein